MTQSEREAIELTHRVLIKARLRAFQGADACEMAGILDAAEYLLAVMLNPGKHYWRQQFTMALRGVADRMPEVRARPREFEEFVAAVRPSGDDTTDG